jgi:hypothetical protein
MKLRRFCSVVLLSCGLGCLAISTSSQAQVICTGNASPPPELPVYDQPPMPAPGYIWTPGYWGGGPLGYFWVPGTWVEPPSAGLLWTPGYWGWRDGIYVWNAGYWGAHVGFYGGVNYGFGYDGVGYGGGRWVNGVFSYNRTVNNFGSVHITNVYNETIVDNNVTRVSFNGGAGGTTVRPTPEEEAAVHEQHVAAIPAQLQHERTAGVNKELLASENHGRPAIAATAKPGEFSGKGVMAAREAAPAEEHLPKSNGAVVAPDTKPLESAKPFEREEGRKPQETLKEEAEPKAKTPEPKPANEAKLPENKPENKPGPANTETRPANRETRLPDHKGEQPNGERKSSHEEVKVPGDKPELPNTRAKSPETTPNAAREAKPSHDEAKLPGDKPELPNTRAKSPEAASNAAHEQPHVTAGSNPHPAPKQEVKNKKPPE